MHIVIAALLVTARFYNLADVSPADRTGATLVAAGILQSSGVDLGWLDCGERSGAKGHGTRAACLVPPREGDLIVRLISSPLVRAHGRPGADALGDAYVDTATSAGTLATVYVDRVAAMARAAGVGRATLLGRVMAHEIGHLLLGTADHRPSGLMRAEWSTTFIRRGIPSDWRLSSLDSEIVRAAALKRARNAPPPPDAAAVPCALARSGPDGAICPTCPVCVTLPADRVALDLLVEPGF